MSFYKVNVMNKLAKANFDNIGSQYIDKVFFKRDNNWEWQAIRTDQYQIISLVVWLDNVDIQTDLSEFYIPANIPITQDPHTIETIEGGIELGFDDYSLTIPQKEEELELLEKIDNTNVLSIESLKPQMRIDPQRLASVATLRQAVTVYIQGNLIIFVDDFGNRFSLMPLRMMEDNKND